MKLFVLCSVIRNSNNKLIELRQIRSFLSIAQTLHFGRAAEMSHLSQPADAVRTRTWSFFSRLLTAAQRKLQQRQERWRQFKNETQQPTEAQKAVEEDIQRITSLVHDIASQLFFASGAFDNPQDRDNERLTPTQLCRFWNESAPLFALLTEEPHPNIAHHIVQALAHLMPCAPREVFLLAAQSVCTSSKAGFQYDSLALEAVVKLIQRALADHRDIFQDRDSECLNALRRYSMCLLKPAGPSLDSLPTDWKKFTGERFRSHFLSSRLFLGSE